MKKVVISLLIVVAFLSSCTVKPVEELTDADKFAQEYNVSNDNPFQYIEDEALLEMVNSGTGILFFGENENDRVVELINLVIEVASLKEIETVYYIDINSLEEETLTKLNEKFAPLFEITEEEFSTQSSEEEKTEEKKELSVPEVYFLQEGKVIAYDTELAELNVEDYYTKDQKNDLKEKYLRYMSKYLSCYCLRD